MPQRLWKSLIFIAILLPAAQFAWRCRAMPEFGYLHDDGLFFVTAKSVAGGSYRIESLPEAPAQTKFPPLYPLYLSLIWRIDPHFPENLSLATAFSFAALALCVVLVWVYFQGEFSERRAWLFAALVAINPYFVLFGCRLFSEVFFSCWVLAAFIALRRPGLRMAMLAGLFAGGAYLSRTAGIALLVSVPLMLLLRKESRRAAAFTAAMLPAVAGWTLWTRTHGLASPDSTLAYYTDYLRYQFLNVGFDNLALVLWKNTDQILWAMGSFVVPKVLYLAPVKILTQVIAVAMISGVVRLARRGIAVDYAAFALVSSGILLVWHFPPNERFILPVVPLLIAGFATEMEHLAAMLKAAWRKSAADRIVAAGFAAALTAVFFAALSLQLFGTFVYLEQQAGDKQAGLTQLRRGYAWIEKNLPPSATVLSYDDPLLYLYSGRRGNYLPLLPRWWYSEDDSSILHEYARLQDYCRERRLQYVYFTSNDTDREVSEDLRARVQRAVKQEPGLTPLYATEAGTIYKVNY